MHITNYLRAFVCRSTKAAYALAVNDIKYVPFAQKMVAVKNTATYYDVRRAENNSPKTLSLRLKLNKYDYLLRNLSFIQPLKDNGSDSNLLSYPNQIPRLEVKTFNSNSHPYFLPGGEFPQHFSITGVRNRTPSV